MHKVWAPARATQCQSTRGKADRKGEVSTCVPALCKAYNSSNQQHYSYTHLISYRQASQTSGRRDKKGRHMQ